MNSDCNYANQPTNLLFHFHLFSNIPVHPGFVREGICEKTKQNTNTMIIYSSGKYRFKLHEFAPNPLLAYTEGVEISRAGILLEVRRGSFVV